MNTKVKLPRCLAALASVFGLLTVGSAADFFEAFVSPPAASDWKIHGDTNLFEWNPAGHLDVTWDSSQTNSYFFRPLHSVIGKDDDFQIELDLKLVSIEFETGSLPPTAFEIAFGFLNIDDATSTNFFRGKGTGTVTNLVEFDYFPDNGLGDTIWPAFWSTNATLNYVGENDYTLATLPLNEQLRIALDYHATNQTLTTTITRDGGAPIIVHPVRLSQNFTDFRVNTFAISSYESQSTTELRVQATIDNIRLVYPQPVVDLAIGKTIDGWTASFRSRTNWIYQLEEAPTLNNWSATGTVVEGTGENIKFPVSNSPSAVFTRIRAVRE